MQNTACRGTDFIRFSMPKFFWDILIEYPGLYFCTYTDRLREIGQGIYKSGAALVDYG
jgi:hypothetical protein